MTARVSDRVAAFDRLRGLIMVLMAIDHASFFIARVHPAETWAAAPPYYADVPAFLTRWLTHLCAPGFFMLMGIGMVWFAAKREADGWSAGRITRHFVTRGAMLLVVQHLVENPAWLMGILSIDPSLAETQPGMPGAAGDVFVGLAVLSALGASLIFWGVAWRTPWWGIVAVCAGAFWATGSLTPDVTAAAQPIPLWKLLLFVPGQTGAVMNAYPWAIWLVPAGIGVAVGRTFRRVPDRVMPLAAVIGTAGVMVFILLRALGLGDAHQPAPGLMGWLSLTKYPPGEAFLSLMLGLDLLLLTALARWPASWLAPLEVYGRVPFFFYLGHLWAFGLVSWAFPDGASMPVMYLLWALTVAALYPACAWYARFKFAEPATSWWRFF